MMFETSWRIRKLTVRSALMFGVINRSVPTGRTGCSCSPRRIGARSPGGIYQWRGPGETQIERHVLPDKKPADFVVGRQQQWRGQRGDAVIVLQHLHVQGTEVVV